MNKKGFWGKIKLFPKTVQKLTADSISMDLRLFLFLLVLVLTVILGVIVILLVTGTFTAGLSESERLVENELLHASEGISKQYGELSVQAIEFAEELSSSIEKQANEANIPLSSLSEHPDVLRNIISREFERALFHLQRSKSSGVFIILDATVNPALDNAQNSRAGLYIKNMEPNIISSFSPNIIVLRGDPIISRNNSLPLHAQWKMEFDISNAPYYCYPMAAANSNHQLPLSRLYYWTTALSLPDTSEEIMLCSVPLIDSQGNVFGVCGLEMSAMLFKLSNMPDNSSYTRLFCTLCPINKNTIKFNQSMLAGGYSAKKYSKDSEILKISEKQHAFYSYKRPGQNSFLGMHKPVQLYPKDSVFADEQWAAFVMVPEEDLVTSITRLNITLIFWLMLLVVLGITASFILSKKFIKPITDGLDIIKSSDLSAAAKTKIPEINDLIEFLALHNQELYEKARQENLSLAILDEFLENTEMLSPAERSVFNLYVKGYTAKEIAETLCLSINTIKTHSKRIYMKLNVTSREELLLYISMLNEIGKEI